MKTILTLIATAIISHADEIELKNGATVTGTVIRYIPAQIEIQTQSGKTVLPVSSLNQQWVAQNLASSPEGRLSGQLAKMETDLAAVQKKLTDSMAIVTKEMAKATPPAVAPAPVEKKLKIEKLGARKVESNEVYVTVAWKAELANNSDNEMRDITVTFNGVDAEQFILWTEKTYKVSLAPGERKTVGGQSLVNPTVWKNTTGYTVSTK